VGVAGVCAVYGLELLASAGWPRGAVASVAWLALGLGAIVTAMRAAQTTPGRERLPWVFVALAAGAWTIGMLVRSAFVIAEVALAVVLVAGAGLLARSDSFDKQSKRALNSGDPLRSMNLSDA